MASCGSFFTGDITGVTVSFLWLQSTTIAASAIINCLPRGFLKWGVPRKIPPKIIDFKSDASLYYKPSSYWGTIDGFLWIFYGFLWIFFGFPWKPDGTASRPQRGLARHPVLPSGRSGSGATPAGDLRFGPQREPGEPRDVRAGDFRGISGWIFIVLQ